MPILGVCEQASAGGSLSGIVCVDFLGNCVIFTKINI